MQAITFIAPPHWLQVPISMLNTLFNRLDQLIAARRSLGVLYSWSDIFFLHLARHAGVTRTQCFLFVAYTS